jgi:hypothetical protein
MSRPAGWTVELEAALTLAAGLGHAVLGDSDGVAAT